MIFGECNCCGQCEIGGNNQNIVYTGLPIGESGAAHDITFNIRKDIPVRPNINKLDKCVLWGEYI